ncbi:hypothetical protein H257_18002 [Aphanomyces astaci]|uniref:Zinc/iron permease n=2 Tax=Aphanomyces astaci TaxID=112090 RepID=W4FCK4_APHAT|nr:hypothetical protein H257_18002 [Aphanomyces astaci]ETV65227.1 hypothetical protein H257_18002 [Aphanomyces astaci]KAF0707483.1 hypothetical protein AaE_013581 [Aphanomyces astaci]RHX99898.1 hypothetical protein DYB36_013517 [Aphanomyces astaci]RHY25778.1 hypothetical protein DYB25_012394 [Aphanomyces astaci]RHY87033.1 hypothetical protein DYB35_009853 [Aphanomyces astaci]|eukprot:XP_009845294.1 hypothetical protein H257_18002 [Aphanomyces astaci]
MPRLSTLLLASAIMAAAVSAHGDHDHDHDHDLSECGIIEDKDDYDQGIHVAAIFIVFGVSILGSLLPVVSSYVSCLRNSQKLLSLLNSFGFGVVISTAFIHMIPSATYMLGNPCLELTYNGIAMVIVVATALAMQLLETELVLLLTKNQQDNNSADLAKLTTDIETSVAPIVPATDGHYHSHHGHSHGDLAKNNTHKKINVLIFEIGVAIHSVIIGLDLGVSTGDGFITLLVAICFHQFFEGVAVGSSAVTAFSNIRSSVFTAVAYSLTTPLGIAIGIAVNSSYSNTSVTSLWVRGVLDSVAGGILVYTGIVELLTYQYTINQEFHAKSGGIRSLNYLFLWLGAASMAIIGKWA